MFPFHSSHVLFSLSSWFSFIEIPVNFLTPDLLFQVIVSRMRYISSQTEREVRFVGLSTALANAGYALCIFDPSILQ